MTATLEYAAIILVFVTVFVALLFLSVMRSRPNQAPDVIYSSKEMHLRELAQVHSNHRMEVAPENLDLFDVVGEGTFGIVRRGILKPNDSPVAVKILKGFRLLRLLHIVLTLDIEQLSISRNFFFFYVYYSEQAGVDDKEEILREISLMKSVGSHENIVCIVGHITATLDNMMLLTEYCSQGDLLNYLK